MTIQEAIKTGRKMKRKGWGGTEYAYAIPTDKIILSIEDILAEDWVVEPEIIEFECKWVVDRANIVPCRVYYADKFISSKGDGILNSVIGKKTRVRIEVIND